MKYFLIAGEASGDLHASNLIRVLRKKDQKACFVGMGGDKMRAEECYIYVDYREMAYMGVVAVLNNLGKIKRNFQIAKQALLKERPEVLILIDYPSFNLRIAKFCKKYLPQTQVVYYIPPKIWAWKEWRVTQIVNYSDHILGIFPFEPAFYAKHGYKCHYVGNPVADVIREFLRETKREKTKEEALIAILPGSRTYEISKCLPTMLAAARRVAGDKYRIVVTAAPGIDDTFYTPYIQGEQLTRNTYTLLQQARVAIVNSGTATLETALIGCPQVAVYHVATSKYLEKLIRPLLFKIKYFTLVNIILDKEVIQELVASRFTQDNVEQELRRLLEDEAYNAKIKAEYESLWTVLGEQVAAESAAENIRALL